MLEPIGALQVTGLPAAMGRLLSPTARRLNASPSLPVGRYNVRLQDPDGMQITLFQAGGNIDSAA
ncbi:MAG: hypothetical protein H6632_11625 [Anaerolineales bacterium]|nr:hypothetical protein [Anaerolineales bacterium]